MGHYCTSKLLFTNALQMVNIPVISGIVWWGEAGWVDRTRAQCITRRMMLSLRRVPIASHETSLRIHGWILIPGRGTADLIFV